LVRSRGRAEGVEVVTSKNVTAEAAACVRLALKNRAVGAPSADPVGVTVTFNLKAAPLHARIVRMARRHPDNPILRPESVAPSRPDFEVVGVFNPAVARVGGSVVLLVRV